MFLTIGEKHGIYLTYVNKCFSKNLFFLRLIFSSFKTFFLTLVLICKTKIIKHRASENAKYVSHVIYYLFKVEMYILSQDQRSFIIVLSFSFPERQRENNFVFMRENCFEPEMFCSPTRVNRKQFLKLFLVCTYLFQRLLHGCG